MIVIIDLVPNTFAYYEKIINNVDSAKDIQEYESSIRHYGITIF